MNETYVLLRFACELPGLPGAGDVRPQPEGSRGSSVFQQDRHGGATCTAVASHSLPGLKGGAVGAGFFPGCVTIISRLAPSS